MDGEKVKWPAGGVGRRLWLAVNALDEAGGGRWGRGRTDVVDWEGRRCHRPPLLGCHQNADSAYFAATQIVCEWAQRWRLRGRARRKVRRRGGKQVGSRSMSRPQQLLLKIL